MAERVGFEPTWGGYSPNRFRVGAVVTASVPLQYALDPGRLRHSPAHGNGEKLARDYMASPQLNSTLAVNTYPTPAYVGRRPRLDLELDYLIEAQAR